MTHEGGASPPVHTGVTGGGGAYVKLVTVLKVPRDVDGLQKLGAHSRYRKLMSARPRLMTLHLTGTD